jgi:hypothetical protein
MCIKFRTFAGLVGACLSFHSLAIASENVAGILRRQTQELLDAITTGSPAIWERYLDPTVIYTDEEGTVMSKAQLVGQIKPLPQGISGNIRVIEFKASVHESTAVTSHLDDEHETFHGHNLHCQYRTTDTWLKTPGGWRLISGQVLALRADPPAVQLNAQLKQEYAGRYPLSPEKTYEIRIKAGGLEGQETGRKAETLLAEVPDILFVPGKPRYRKVFLRGSDGRITGFAERREAWDIVWTRVP